MSELPFIVAKRLAHHETLDGLGLGRIEGRADLRGLVFRRPDWEVRDRPDERLSPERMAVDELRFRNVVLEDLDFSGVVWDRWWLEGAMVRNCVFDGAQLDDFRIWDSWFENCSFKDARLSGMMGVGWSRLPWRKRRAEWRGVDFRGADLRDTHHGVELYVDCDFRGAKLTLVDFDGAEHVRSRFAGELKTVFFSRFPWSGRKVGAGNLMQDVDFSEARLVGSTTFWGLDLVNVRLPETQGHVFIRPKVQVARRASELLDVGGGSGGLDQARELMASLIREGPDAREAVAVVHVTDLGAPSVRAAALDVLRRAAEDLGAECWESGRARPSS
jgi:uncharacterized protein YjbI with pentapeptide repeats